MVKYSFIAIFFQIHKINQSIYPVVYIQARNLILFSIIYLFISRLVRFTVCQPLLGYLKQKKSRYFKQFIWFQ